jgi:hypothetical protein
MFYGEQGLLCQSEPISLASKVQIPGERTSLSNLFTEACMATVCQQTWENVLLPLAYEAEHQSLAPSFPPVNDRGLLDRAYVMQFHYVHTQPNFLYGYWLTAF